MKIVCEKCGHEQETNAAAILGASGGKKSKRKITPEQRAKMEAAKKAKREKEMKILSDFDKLTITEQNAFLAWFAGGKTHLTKYGTRKDVFFGKAECEWVDFDEFWLNKLPALGWVSVKEVERFTAVGMVNTPEAVRYEILATNKGHDVREAYWARLQEKAKREANSDR